MVAKPWHSLDETRAVGLRSEERTSGWDAPAHTERGLSISGSQQVGNGTHCARFVVALGSVLAMRRDAGSDVWTPRTRRGL